MRFCWTLLSVCLLFVSTEQRAITAVPGQDVTLTCRAPNNDPITAVKWSRTDVEPEYDVFYLNEQLLQEYRHQSSASRVDLRDRLMKDGDVSLILKNVTINDTGTYECRIVQGGANRWKRANLDIYPFSIIYLSAVAPPEQKNITAESGQNITLTCRAPDNNSIRAVEWSRVDLGDKHVLLYKDKQFETHNQHESFNNRVDLQDKELKDGDGSLILKNVMANDTGTYKCRVFVRKTRSWSFSIIYLRVVAPPPGPPGGLTQGGAVGLEAGLLTLIGSAVLLFS